MTVLAIFPFKRKGQLESRKRTEKDIADISILEILFLRNEAGERNF